MKLNDEKKLNAYITNFGNANKKKVHVILNRKQMNHMPIIEWLKYIKDDGEWNEYKSDVWVNMWVNNKIKIMNATEK